MPFEIVLSFQDTMYKNFSNISRIQKLQEALKEEKYLSKSLSIVDAMKFISQAYANGKPSKYELDFSNPKDQRYFSRIINSKYFKNTFINQKMDNSNGFVRSFIDSTQHSTRITLQIADIGTSSMDSLIDRINERINNIINPEQYFVRCYENEDFHNFYLENSIINYQVKQELTKGDLELVNNFPENMAEISELYGMSQFISAVKKAVSKLKVHPVITGSVYFTPKALLIWLKISSLV